MIYIAGEAPYLLGIVAGTAGIVGILLGTLIGHVSTSNTCAQQRMHMSTEHTAQLARAYQQGIRQGITSQGHTHNKGKEGKP